jgi:hypothetical protein
VPKFLDPLTVTEIDDKIFQVSGHAFRYQSDLVAELITVPVGFYTDFASVPRIGIIYAMLGDCAHEPAVIHDWLYYSAITTRDMADNVLLEAMKVFGISAWRRWPIYWGVRAGGWYAWNDHRKKGNPKEGAFKDTPNIAAQ